MRKMGAEYISEGSYTLCRFGKSNTMHAKALVVEDLGNRQMRTALLKVSVVGSGSVGKTSTILRYTNNTFRDNYIPTLGVGFAAKETMIGDRGVRLQIWDMGGQEKLYNVRANYYFGSLAILYVFDVTDRKSFDELASWKEEVEKHVDTYSAVLFGNKVDLVDSRVVSKEEGQRTAEEIGAAYLEGSAKADTNVDDAFGMLCVGALKILAAFEQQA